MDSKKISVITATYNVADILPNLIACLRSQTEAAFEWVVADGGSNDGTLDLLTEIDDLNLVVSSQPDFGIYDALNRAIKLSSGDYYLVLGADDLLYESGIKLYNEAIKKNSADIVSGAIMAGNKRISAQTHKSTILKMQNALISCHSVGAVIRKGLHESLDYYKKDFPIAADQYFIMSAAQSGARFAYIEDVVGEYDISGYSRQNVGSTLLDFFKVQLRLHNKFIVVPLYFLKIMKNFNKL